MIYISFLIGRDEHLPPDASSAACGPLSPAAVDAGPALSCTPGRPSAELPLDSFATANVTLRTLNEGI